MIGEPQELILSDRVTVTVAELDGYESGRADTLVSTLLGTLSTEDMKAGNVPVMGMILLTSKVYGICSLRSINGTPVEPLRGIAKYAEAARQLSVRESNELQKWSSPLYNAGDDDEQAQAEIKKEDSAPL